MEWRTKGNPVGQLKCIFYSRPVFNKAPMYVLSIYGQLNLNIIPIKGGGGDYLAKDPVLHLSSDAFD